MSPLDIAIAVGVLFVGATIQGSIGFGANLTAAPILALIDLRFLPGPLLLNALTLTSITWRRERADVDWRAVGWSLGGRLPATRSERSPCWRSTATPSGCSSAPSCSSPWR